MTTFALRSSDNAKEYEVKRVVVEYYYVMATSRQDAIAKAEGPAKIFVRRETAKLIKP